MKSLIIGPYAPDGSVGVNRITSICRALIKRGYQVDVLCLSEKTIVDRYKGTIVSLQVDDVVVHYYDLGPTKDGFLKQLIADAQIFNKALIGLLREHNYDFAIISVGPFYTLGGVHILQKRAIPCILDYRDLNFSSADKRKQHKRGLRSTLHYYYGLPIRFFLERRALNRAKAITVVHPDMGINISKFFKIDSHKIFTVYNGYDDFLLCDVQAESKEKDVFRIGYFGKLMYYDKAYTEMFLKGIDTVYRQGKKIELLHIGNRNDSVISFIKNNCSTHEWYKNTGFVEYSSGMRALSTCSCFYLEYTMFEGPGTKIFDYIYWNKPVIAILRDGIPLEGMIDSFPGGFSCKSTTDVCNALEKIMSGEVEKLCADYVKNDFSRSKQNEVLIEVINRITNE